MKLITSIAVALACALVCTAATPRKVAERAMEGYRLFLRDSLPSDRPEGYAIMLDAAWEGDAKAANNIGWLMEHGEFIEKDLPGALRWYERAADQRLPAAALNYVNIVFNHPEALDGRAADVDRVARAAMLAGTSLAMGRGLHHDYRQGEDLIMRAAILGDEDAAITVAQQLEIYPDSFSSLPLPLILSECNSLLPSERQVRVSDPQDAKSVADTLLSPSFWYSRISDDFSSH